MIMRVAHMLPCARVDGTAHATLRAARALAAHDFRSTAFCLERAEPVHDLFSDAGFDTAPWRLPEGSAGARRLPHAAVRLAVELWWRRIDVVSCADLDAVTPPVVRAARLAGAALVCHVRGRETHLPAETQGRIGEVSRFVFASQAAKRAFGEQLSDERGRVIYDGVDVFEVGDLMTVRARARADIIRELDLPSDAWLVGMVTQTDTRAELLTLARAVARVRLHDPSAHLIIVGGAVSTPAAREHLVEVRRLLETCGVASRFHFTGVRTDIKRFLRGLDVAVLSTPGERLPLDLWEAMAEGVPLVASDVDGVTEVLTDGVTGLLARPNDVEELAERLLLLRHDPVRARAIGSAAREHARIGFSTEALGRSLAETYAAARAEPRRARW